MSVEQAISRSQHAFATLVWPRLSNHLGQGRLIPVETVTDSNMTKALDMLAGVDTWLISDGHVYPIASRVQYGATAWRTFTIRRSVRSGLPTEYHKRIDAIRSGALYPRFTVQAYINGDQLLAAAAVDTRHLIERCATLEHQVRTNPTDGAQFIYVQWDQLDSRHTYIVDNLRGPT